MNLEILKFIQGGSSPALDNMFQLVTMLGEEGFAILFSSFIFWCLDRKFGYKLFFIYLTGVGINEGLKNFFHFARPIGQPGIRSLRVETATGFSFPSGHTQGTTVLMVSLFSRMKKRWFYIAGTLIVFLVAYSRLYLGVHWPTDVLGGIIIGVLWVYVADKLFEIIKKFSRLYILIIGAVISVISFPLITDVQYFKFVGAAFGFIIGFIIEDRYIRFNSKADIKVQFAKCITGFLGILAIKSGLKLMLPATAFCHTLRYMLVAIWIIAGVPYVFEKLLKNDRVFILSE